MKVALAGAPLLLVALAAGCAGPRTTLQPEPAPRSEALPNWRFEPLSWAKLEAIETWLDESYGAPAGLRAEAELELAEGRLVFAERERLEVDARVMAARIARCSEGFQRVLDDETSSRDQRARARSGLDQIARLSSAPSGLALPRTLARVEWSAGAPNPARLTPHTGPWSRITIHHSVSSPNGSDVASTSQLLRSIQRTHMDSEGMGDIGYHFLIDPAGHVVEGRSLRWRGAHAGGRNNVANLGICLLGNFDTERPSREALQALGQLTEQLRARYGIRRAAVFGHKELKGTACPGTHLQRWVNAYRAGSAPLAGVVSGSTPLAGAGSSGAGRSGGRPASVR